jgi:hypothetical protein
VAAAIRVTELPFGKLSLQSSPQLIPPGALLTTPVPVPALVTVRADVLGGGAVNVAVTVWLPIIFTVQVPVPLQPLPLQPAKVEPPVGEAVSVTSVSNVKFAEHVAVQPLMPPGALVTVPEPVPSITTVSVVAATGGMNAAVTI